MQVGEALDGVGEGLLVDLGGLCPDPVAYSSNLKVTPAMAAGLTHKLWEMSDMVKLLEEWKVAQTAS
jgi:hypothetical protein